VLTDSIIIKKPFIFLELIFLNVQEIRSNLNLQIFYLLRLATKC